MRNLYDILGLSSNATVLQIEQAYLVRKNAFKGQEGLLSEGASLEMRAVEEAYALLSSPARRERYDQQLKKTASQPVRYEVVESRGFPWIGIALLALVLVGGLFIYQHQQNKARIEQLRIEESRAKAEAEQAELLALAEQQRLESEKLAQQREMEANARRDLERNRYESQQIHGQLESFEARRQREINREEREARQAREREEYAAKAAVRQQHAAMERALSRPIDGGSRRSGVTVIQNEPARPAYPSQR
ncbi:hypothetical protein [Janthinobacterium sp. 17J80-10]|uniref:hypothetical protein n=1 Tax=Janthinobacterium sp. 17J80-10 TaxID=2497863 RepID=UPI001005685D|nr:hypothetical protein [Janthinobacterium sp. 17J80-10]QAU32867.1 hypothetical protein EKL02_01030 [Janthinobacterium sp. 17J80-10]